MDRTEFMLLQQVDELLNTPPLIVPEMIVDMPAQIVFAEIEIVVGAAGDQVHN